MITAADSEYQATKRIKQGKAQLAAPFDELAAWIGARWQVTVLNVIYIDRDQLHAPRLYVIVEHASEAEVFHDGFNFDWGKQLDIVSRFKQMIAQDGEHRYDVEGLFVAVGAFAPIAMQEADSRISSQDIDSLKQQIGNPDLWEISRLFGQVTFLFYTYAQVKEYTAAGKQAEYARRYLELLKPHDEFGYCTPDRFTVAFDSKQNFDEHYQSNWFYYYK